MSQKTTPKKPSSWSENRLKFLGLASEMALSLLVAGYLGREADQYFQNEKPVITLAFLLFALFGTLWRLIRGLKS